MEHIIKDDKVYPNKEAYDNNDPLLPEEVEGLINNKDNKMYDTQNDYDPISPEEILDSLEPHVWCVDATAIAWFPTGVEAIEKYNEIKEFVVIKHGDKTLEVNKEDIAVFPEYAFDTL